MTQHPAPDRFRDYVMGSLTGAEADTFEAHVMACSACLEVLQDEARVEEQLHSVAMAPPRRRSRRIAIALAALVACLGGWYLALPRPEPTRRSVERLPLAPLPVCLRAPSRCEDAERHGLHTPGTPIPRYEDAAPARLSLAPKPSKEKP